MANGLTRKGECHGIFDCSAGCRYSRYRYIEINLVWKPLTGELGESVEIKVFPDNLVWDDLSEG